MELDFSFGIQAIGARFRCNVFNQRGAVGAVYRLIPEKIRTFGELGLPPVLAKLSERPRGLVLVTGPTGSGKSTTLAAMLDKINAERHDHILTIEDPIEYIHQHKNCLVNQREVHSDTESFTNALRAALREDPDIVLIGEMRDLETVEAALKIAETGPLDVRHAAHQLGGADHQPHHRHLPGEPAGADPHAAVAGARGIVCQALLPRADGKGRVVSLEIMVPTPAIRNLIRDDKVHQIYGSMQSGQEKLGMQTANQSLASLYMKRPITLETAMTASSNKDELQDMIKRGVGVVAGAGLGRAPGTAAADAVTVGSSKSKLKQKDQSMPNFAYTGRTRAGQTVSGERAADTMDAAVAALRREQIHGHADHAGQGARREAAAKKAKGGQDRQEGVGQEPGGLHPAVLRDDRRRPAARAVPRHSRHAGRGQELRAPSFCRPAPTSNRARRWPTR